MHVRILELSSYIGLTVAICEILATLRPELKYIWINPQRFTLIKFLYLLSRYLGLAVHITNTVFAILVGHYQVIPVHLCRIGLVYQGAVLFVMLGILDVILMIRVYALYNRRTSIAVIFGILLLSKFTSAILSAFLALPNQQYNSTCLVMTGSQVPLYLFAVGELVIQLTILGFTLIRHIFATRDGWSNPLFGVLSRDGSMAFAATTVAIISIITSSLRPAEATHLVFPALVVISSSAGCRLIINMQRLADPVSEEPVLTTMDSNAWAAAEINFHRDDNESATVSSCVSEISTVNFS